MTETGTGTGPGPGPGPGTGTGPVTGTGTGTKTFSGWRSHGQAGMICFGFECRVSGQVAVKYDRVEWVRVRLGSCQTRPPPKAGVTITSLTEEKSK